MYIPVAPYSSARKQHDPTQVLGRMRKNLATTPWNNISLTTLDRSELPWKTWRSKATSLILLSLQNDVHCAIPEHATSSFPFSHLSIRMVKITFLYFFNVPGHWHVPKWRNANVAVCTKCQRVAGTDVARFTHVTAKWVVYSTAIPQCISTNFLFFVFFTDDAAESTKTKPNPKHIVMIALHCPLRLACASGCNMLSSHVYR